MAQSYNLPDFDDLPEDGIIDLDALDPPPTEEAERLSSAAARQLSYIANHKQAEWQKAMKQRIWVAFLLGSIDSKARALVLQKLGVAHYVLPGERSCHSGLVFWLLTKEHGRLKNDPLSTTVWMTSANMTMSCIVTEFHEEEQEAMFLELIRMDASSK